MKEKTLYFTVFWSVMLLVLTGVFLLLMHFGRIEARAESRAKRGVFNKKDDIENISTIITDRSGYLRIPLPETVDEEDISVTGDPMKKMVMIRIAGADEEFYKKNFFSGEMTGISDVRYGYADGVSTVELDTEDIRIPVSEYTRGSFFIKVASPKDVYDRVVVVDAGHGGDDPGSVVYGIEEKGITRRVAGKLSEKLMEMGDNTMVYMTDPDDRNVSESERAAIAREVDADLYISIHTDADADTRVTNGVSARASDDMLGVAVRLTSEIAAACEQYDLGSSKDKSDQDTELSGIPVIKLKLGYITNKSEALKMDSEEYQDKVAGTIAHTVNNLLKRGDHE